MVLDNILGTGCARYWSYGAIQNTFRANSRFGTWDTHSHYAVTFSVRGSRHGYHWTGMYLALVPTTLTDSWRRNLGSCRIKCSILSQIVDSSEPPTTWTREEMNRHLWWTSAWFWWRMICIQACSKQNICIKSSESRKSENIMFLWAFSYFVLRF